jgi:hypothetical protein
VTDEELASVSITRDKFHGEWNYRIKPRRRSAATCVFDLLLLNT